MKNIALLAGAAIAAAVVLVVGWPHLDSQAATTDAAVTATPIATNHLGTDVVRFADGSDRLAMLRVEAIKPQALPLTDALSGRVAYDEDATSRVTTAFAGRITKLLAAPGDQVKAGQALATVDSPDFGSAASDLAKAKADQERKRLALERSRDLLEGGVIARKDFEDANADYATARAETDRAMQKLHNMNPHGTRITGESFSLTSPMTGVVSERTANPAMEVSPAVPAPLFVVTDLTRLWVFIDLPERLLGKVKVGAKVAIETDAYPDKRFDATVTQIGQILDPATRRIAVRARVDNRSLELRPEMFVRASILQPQGEAVKLPNEALFSQGLNSYVFLQKNPREFKRQQVHVASKGADFTFVDQGLGAGDKVVTRGALLLAAELTDTSSAKP